MIRTMMLFVFLLSELVYGEQINVRYRSLLETDGTDLVEYPQTQDQWAVHRVLYDEEYSYLVIEVGIASYSRNFYHYCGVSKSAVDAMIEHSSSSKYFAHEIKGKYDCRLNEMPPY